MSDITALENRITTALDRIRVGVDKMAAGSTGGPDLQEQLDEERMANAQLQERVRTLKARQDGMISDLEAKIEDHRAQLSAVDAEMQRLRQSNADMREINAQLRAAASEGAADPELINRAMMAEIEALEAQRASEAAEVAAVIAELKPLIEEV